MTNFGLRFNDFINSAYDFYEKANTPCRAARRYKCYCSCSNAEQKSEISRNLDIFNALYKELQTFYVDSIDAEKSINTAIAAMLNDIDPYTEYFSAKEQDQFRTMTTGEYGGIGSVIQQTPKGVVVVEPYKGSPAQQAGLRPGDIFLQIDGDTVSSWTSDKVSEKLKGQSGSTLKLVMKRPWVEDSILNFELKRGKIQMPSVPYVGMIRPGIGYVGLTTFSEKSYPEVRAGVEQLIKGWSQKVSFLTFAEMEAASWKVPLKYSACFCRKAQLS